MSVQKCSVLLTQISSILHFRYEKPEMYNSQYPGFCDVTEQTRPPEQRWFFQERPARRCQFPNEAECMFEGRRGRLAGPWRIRRGPHGERQLASQLWHWC